jgi:hypothetical protein
VTIYVFLCELLSTKICVNMNQVKVVLTETLIVYKVVGVIIYYLIHAKLTVTFKRKQTYTLFQSICTACIK